MALEFKVSSIYRVRPYLNNQPQHWGRRSRFYRTSSRIPRAIQRNQVSKNKTKKENLWAAGIMGKGSYLNPGRRTQPIHSRRSPDLSPRSLERREWAVWRQRGGPELALHSVPLSKPGCPTSHT